MRSYLSEKMETLYLYDEGAYEALRQDFEKALNQVSGGSTINHLPAFLFLEERQLINDPVECLNSFKDLVSVRPYPLHIDPNHFERFLRITGVEMSTKPCDQLQEMKFDAISADDQYFFQSTLTRALLQYLRIHD